MEKEKNTPATTSSRNSFLDARQLYREREESFQFDVMGEHNGVIFINDAASLSVENTRNSMDRISSPILLITGVENCNPEYEGLKNSIRNKAKAVIFIGSEKKSIFRACLGNQILFVSAENIDEALSYAVIFSRPGDAILYSPACSGRSSLSVQKQPGEEESDQMAYGTSGAEFKKAVEKIIGKRQG